ncbi:helix-turn-helix transcriptional regulator [Ottowia sp.]|uniref:helix-turn-helix domain-containing protein n=1 Tax=Ottowia sp. TaxID=1898956 RepID=UPI0026019B42|nr:helix-turn-helix transcriptional regulator [Ottowia sp.]
MELNYDPLKRFGRHLAELRRAQGVSQERLAHESGLARSYLSGIERGMRNVSLMNICVLAETLQFPPARLLEFPTTPESEEADGR